MKKSSSTLFIVGIIIFSLILLYVNALSKVDNNLQDAVFMSDTSIVKIDRPVSDKIIVVGIDEESMQEFGRWPWNRSLMASAIDILHKQDAAVIGVDVIYSDYSDEENDTALVNSVKNAGNVIIPSCLYDVGTEDNPQEPQLVTPFTELKDACINAHINTMPEDGVIRQTINVIATSEGDINSLAIEAYSRYMKKTKADSDNIAKFRKYENNDHLSYFDCQRDSNVFCYMSFKDLFQEELPQDYFKDSIVLIGPCEQGMQDAYFTSGNKSVQTYGVIIWANIIQNMLNGNSIRSAGILNYIILLIVGLLSAYVFTKTHPAKGAVILILFNAVYFVFGRFLYKNGIRISFIYVVILSIMMYSGLLVIKYIKELLERKRVTGVFGRYVAPQIVNQILEQGEEGLKLGGSKRLVTVLFVDIRGFTTMSEKMSPEQVVEILNEYLNLCATSIMDNEGTLDKFVGDATMAIFNAPIDLEQHALKAVKTALQMKHGSLELEKKLQERFGRAVKFGIGINTGYAVVGNIGCNFRMDYTAIGDTVNTSARLESNAKPGQILISQSTYDLVKDEVEVTPLGGIKVKGKEEEVQIYQVEGLK